MTTVKGLTCPNCAGVVRDASRRSCEYCGAALPDPVGPPSIAERLEAVERSPEVARWLVEPVELDVPVRRYVFRAVFGLIFAGMALFMVEGFATTMGPVAVVPALFVALGLWMTVSAISKWMRVSRAAVVRRPAAVVDRRAHVQGDGDGVHTSYHATLEFAHGERTEFALRGPQLGTTTVGDVGLAYLKADLLLDFRRTDTRHE